MEIEFNRKWIFQRQIRKSEKPSQISWKENAHTGEKEKNVLAQWGKMATSCKMK